MQSFESREVPCFVLNLTPAFRFGFAYFETAASFEFTSLTVLLLNTLKPFQKEKNYCWTALLNNRHFLLHIYVHNSERSFPRDPSAIYFHHAIFKLVRIMN